MHAAPDTRQPTPPSRPAASASADVVDPYDALGDLYDEWVVSVTEDIPFYLALADRSVVTVAASDLNAARIVELGAGSGRVTNPLLARAHEVWAVDIAAGQLARAAASAADQGYAAQLHTVVADMRALDHTPASTTFAPLASSIDLVIAPFRALLHVAPDATKVFTAVCALLRPDGMVAFDVFHPTPAVMDGIDGVWQLRRRLDRDGGERWAIWERATLSADGEELILDVRCDRQDLPTEPSRSASMLLHVPPPHHWSDAIAAAGLELVSVSGWFDESPFEPGMTDSVWIARRPE
ncbi:MAG: class I SAM-dependent methyltransferase [Thermoleophilia bacterium]|nr:class I SAM-dependent methyltransferase [Thermoleophilia bacterium]